MRGLYDQQKEFHLKSNLAGICWCSEVTNMTGKYFFVFATGGTLGWAISQPIAGAIFEINPFSVVSINHTSCFIDLSGTILCINLPDSTLSVCEMPVQNYLVLSKQLSLVHAFRLALGGADMPVLLRKRRILLTPIFPRLSYSWG